MKPFRRRGTLVSAADSVARGAAYLCEPLERRVLLDANDPVIVMIEHIQELGDIHTIPDVEPWLWRSPVETLWDLYAWDEDPPPWDNEDRDENGYPDDAYGWSFGNPGSPNFIHPNAGHGRFVTLSAVNVLNSAGTQASRVKIMYVIGGGGFIRNSGVNSDALQYVLDRKLSSDPDVFANIVAIGAPVFVANRAGAEALADAGIMLIGGQSNANTNFDSDSGNTLNAFYSATPRPGVQAPALDNVIPITTDPSVELTGYGINSFYGGVTGHGMQSFSGPAGAAMAAVAVQAYQDAHSGQNPTIQQIKRAMMSGVDHVSGLDNRTITHDYVNGVRQDGGLFNLSKIITAINQTTPELTNVSMTQVSIDSLGTNVEFDLNSLGGTVSNWTISWGDNSGSDHSGVEVLAGNVTRQEHRFPFENVPHHYFPTIYAMSGTKQVYLPAPSAQAEVVNTKWAPTSGQDNYTLARNGADVTLTLQNASGTTSASFAPTDLPTALISLGVGADNLTIDFTNGDPLEGTALTVTGVNGAGNGVRLIGSAGADTINVSGSTVTINGRQFSVDGNLGVYVDAAAGDDILNVTANPRVHLDASETFGEINVGSGGGITVDAIGNLVLRTQTLSIASGGFLDLANNRMIVDYSGTSPFSTIQSLLVSGYAAGNWTGNGIRSSTAAASTDSGIGFAEAADLYSSFPATFGGQEVDDTALLLRYTGYGDADLNGQVTLADFNRLAANYGQSNRYWVHGDFDYDGEVNLSDFNRLAANFGLSDWMDDFDEAEGGFNDYTYDELWDMLMGGGG